jgi:hypothetical protein
MASVRYVSRRIDRLPLLVVAPIERAQPNGRREDRRCRDSTGTDLLEQAGVPTGSQISTGRQRSGDAPSTAESPGVFENDERALELAPRSPGTVRTSQSLSQCAGARARLMAARTCRIASRARHLPNTQELLGRRMVFPPVARRSLRCCRRRPLRRNRSRSMGLRR